MTLKESNMTQKAFSRDGEQYFSGLSYVFELLDDDGALVPGRTYYEGVASNPKPSQFFDVDFLVEDMQERAYDEANEWAESYFDDVPTAKIEELNSLISNWLDANVNVSFFTVGGVREVTITQEMIDFHRKDA